MNGSYLRMRQFSHGTNPDSDHGEFAYGASLSALGPVMLSNERLLNELNVPKGNPRRRTLIQCPNIVPCTSASRRRVPNCHASAGLVSSGDR